MVIEFASVLQILLFIALVAVPLSVRFVTPHPDRLGRFTNIALPCCAAFGVVTLFLEKGTVAAALAFPWWFATALVALRGLLELRTPGPKRLEEMGVAVGHLYLAVGGFWFVLSRYTGAALGFTEPILTLTAMHFHYAGFFAPLVLGRKGRQFGDAHRTARRFWKGSFLAVLAGIPLLALGITASPRVEMLGAFCLVAGLAVFAAVNFATLNLVPRGAARVLSALSSASTVYAMSWAACFAFATLFDRPRIDYPTMALHHGLANGLGFTLLGLLSVALAAVPARTASS